MVNDPNEPDHAAPALPSAVYDKLKSAALVYLPALGALYFALAQIWDLPKAEEIVGTITAVDAFLGLGLKVSSANYTKNIPEPVYAGVLNSVTDPEDGSHSFSLGLNSLPADIHDQQQVLFKVNRIEPPVT